MQSPHATKYDQRLHSLQFSAESLSTRGLKIQISKIMLKFQSIWRTHPLQVHI